MKFRLVFILVFLAAAACVFDKDERQSSTEIGNPTITGKVLNPNDKPAVSARVVLYSADFNPLDYHPDTLGSEETGPMETTTGSAGHYTFKNVPPGGFNIWTENSKGTTSALLPSILIPVPQSDTTFNMQDIQLAPPGAMVLVLEELGMSEAGQLYVPGTGIQSEIGQAELESGIVHIENMPAGPYTEIFFRSASADTEYNIIQKSINIVSSSYFITGSPYLTWAHSKKITINTTASGELLDSTLTDFPLLVRLDSFNFNFSDAAANGSDIRFTDAGGTPLSYEIDTWYALSGESIIWVRVPEILPNDSLQHIFMYYGNPGVPSLSDGKAVFDTARGYTGVWHLGEAANINSYGYKDATANTLHGTGFDMPVGPETQGITGLAQNFNGSTSRIDIDPAPAAENMTRLSVSAWFRARSEGQGGAGRILSRTRWALIVSDTTDIEVDFAPTFFHHTGDSIEDGEVKLIGDNNAWQENRWYHIAVSADNSTLSSGVVIYINGTEVGRQKEVDGNVPVFLFDDDKILTIGSENADYFHFNGFIDEVRLSNTPRPEHWHRFSYNSQKPGSQLLKFSR